MLHDELNVLARDSFTLEFIDLTDFGNDVVLCALFTTIFEDFVDICLTIREEITLLDPVTNAYERGAAI